MTASQLAATLDEIATTIRQGHPAFSVAVSPGVTTIICTDDISGERWKRHTPNGLLPGTKQPVQVLVVAGVCGGAA